MEILEPRSVEPVVESWLRVALARGYAKLGRWKEARRQLEQAWENEPRDWTVGNDLAWLIATEPTDGVLDPERALSVALECVSLTRRGEAAALDTLAAAHAAAGQFREAIAASEEALALVPSGDNAGEARAARRRVLEARRELYRLGLPYRSPEQPAFTFADVRAHVRGQPVAVEEVFSQYAAEIPDDSAWAGVAARLAWILATHDDPRARDIGLALRLEEALRKVKGPERARCLTACAAARAGAGEFESAAESVRLAQRALDEESRGSTAADAVANGFSNLALVADRTELRRRLERLGEEFARRIPARESPVRPYVEPGADIHRDRHRLAYWHFLLARRLLDDGQTEAGLTALRAALAYDPADGEANLLLGHLLDAQQGAEAAAPYFLVAAALNKADAPAHVRLAVMYLEFGRTEDAVKQLRAALVEQPDWLLPLNELAWLLATHPEERMRCGEESLRLAERLVKSSAEPEPRHLDTLAAAQAEVGRCADAVATLDRALALVEAPLSGGSLADTLVRERQADAFRLRRDQYREGRPYRDLAQPATDGPALLQRAIERKQQGDGVAAVELLRAALRRRPDWDLAENELAWLLATHPNPRVRRGEEAVRIAERLARRTKLLDAGVLDTLAAAYAEAGRFADAVQTATAALDQLPRQLVGDPLLVRQEAYAARRETYLRQAPHRDPAPDAAD